MKKIISSLLLICFALTGYSQSQLWIYNDSPDRLYIMVNYHALPVSDCEVDYTPPSICLFPATDYVYIVPMGYVVHSVRAFRANMGCSISEVDWTTDGHLILPPMTCAPTIDDVPYDFTLSSCGGSCQKVLIE